MTTTVSDGTNHWLRTAACWQQVGQPLRPGAEDVAFYQAAVDAWGGAGAPRALILGVTREIYHLNWPEGTDLLAADHTQSMIDLVWPGPKERALLCKWTELPLPDASRDIVLCDGGWMMLPYPDAQQKLAEELSRVIAPGGMFVIRHFTPPSVRESADQVMTDLLSGKIPNLNQLKLRLSMALQASPREGAALADVWQRIHEIEPDYVALAKRLGWEVEHLSAIDSYRNSSNRYYFINPIQMATLLEPEGFVPVSFQTGKYEMAAHCPTLTFRKP